MTDAEHVRAWAGGGLASLEAARQRIDDLNVYPVPDGDTGTNLMLTVRSLAEALDDSTAADRASLAREVTRAALMGARGNSGVILSQIVRGAAESLAGDPDELDAAALARALRAASDAAYRAVRRPVEGTMLSVVREVAEEAEVRAEQELPVEQLLTELVLRAEEAVARTPQQLEILRDAGVVDAGGAGLLELLRGVAAAITGAKLPPPPQLEAVGFDAVHQELSRFRYCTAFVIEGAALERDVLEQQLEQLGDSVLVVGDPTALKVHVHTDDPGAALSMGTAVGTVDRIEIANMHEQTARREERLLRVVGERPATAAVAVAIGDGNRLLFEGLGAARVVAGGQTMNPSTADLVEAVQAVDAEEVVLLPNNANVVLAAEQAARLAGRHVAVVGSDSIPAGLAAMVAFNPSRSADENAASMQAAAAAAATGEVAIASRDVELNGVAVRAGAWVGIVDGEPVAGGDEFDAVAIAVAERLLVEPRDLLTLLTGEDEPDLDALVEHVALEHPELEIDVQSGGQPHYPLLLSAE